MPLSPFEPCGLAPGGSNGRPHPQRCCHSKDNGRACSRRPPSAGNSHKTIRSRSSVPSSAPLYLPIPHVRIPTDSTRRPCFRVHRRDLSPQSRKTLRPNAVCKGLPLWSAPARQTSKTSCFQWDYEMRGSGFTGLQHTESPAGSGCRRGRFANYLPLN